MTAIDNAKSYDWTTWLIGIMRSFLSGGAAAFLTLGGGSLVGVPPKQVWLMMLINFLAMGLYRMGEFLTLHGAPDKLQQSLDTAAAATKDAGKAIAEARAENTKP